MFTSNIVKKYKIYFTCFSSESGSFFSTPAFFLSAVGDAALAALSLATVAAATEALRFVWDEEPDLGRIGRKFEDYNKSCCFMKIKN